MAKESGTKASCRIQCRPLLYNRSVVSTGYTSTYPTGQARVGRQVHLLRYVCVCMCAFPYYVTAIVPAQATSGLSRLQVFRAPASGATLLISPTRGPLAIFTPGAARDLAVDTAAEPAITRH